ncbi:MAG TPA: YkgJ family cysteine cluster protein [Aggregatilineaceae bacterium]|nr:YkgJ family cysteine cluster protein [Aggregatilineaceae bacterium]
MIETDLDRIAAVSDQQRDDTQAFMYYVQTMWDQEGRSEAELDALVEEIAAEVVPQIDCTGCANCCRSLGLGLTPSDISAMARALHVSGAQVIARYVDFEAARREGEWGMMRCSPCPLLRANRCSIYSSRPSTLKIIGHVRAPSSATSIDHKKSGVKPG